MSRPMVRPALPVQLSVLILCCAVVATLSLSGCARSAKPAPVQDELVHTVTYSGENLGRIAAWYTGSFENWKSIEQRNPGLSTATLKIGDRVTIPALLVRKSAPMPESFLHASLYASNDPVGESDSEAGSDRQAVGVGHGSSAKTERRSGAAVSTKSKKTVLNKPAEKEALRKKDTGTASRSGLAVRPAAKKPAPEKGNNVASAAKPVAGKRAAVKPVAAKPVTVKPVTVKPAAAKSAAVKKAATKSTATRAEAKKNGPPPAKNAGAEPQPETARASADLKSPQPDANSKPAQKTLTFKCRGANCEGLKQQPEAQPAATN